MSTYIYTYICLYILSQVSSRQCCGLGASGAYTYMNTKNTCMFIEPPVEEQEGHAP